MFLNVLVEVFLGVCFPTHMGSGNIQKKCAYSSRSIYHATTSGVVPKSSVQSINDFLCSMHSSYAVCLVHFILPLLCFDAFFRHVFANNSSTIIKASRDNSFLWAENKAKTSFTNFFGVFSTAYHI